MLSLRPNLPLQRSGSFHMTQYLNKALGYVYRMDSWEWFGVMLVMLVVGFICMKGFGRQ
jgi:hypothetical protein